MHSDLFFQVSGRDGKIPKLVRFKLSLCLSSFPVASTSTLPLACQNNTYQQVSWKLWAVISYLEKESVTYNRLSSRDEEHLRWLPLLSCGSFLQENERLQYYSCFKGKTLHLKTNNWRIYWLVCGVVLLAVKALSRDRKLTIAMCPVAYAFTTSEKYHRVCTQKKKVGLSRSRNSVILEII